MMRGVHIALLAWIGAVPLVAQTDWIVDATGGGHFTDLPQAVAAAAPGDGLIVRAGSYTGTTINFGLRIVGTTSARVTSGVLVIQAVPVSQGVSIANLTVESGVTIDSCPGPIVLDACAMVRSGGTSATMSNTALRIMNSAHVAVHRCTVVSSSFPNQAITIADSTVALTDTYSVGSSPYPYFANLTQLAFPGGPGLSADRSVLHLTNPRLTGGGDGIGLDYNWFTPFPIAGPPAMSVRSTTVRIAGNVSSVVTRSSGSVPDLEVTGGNLTVDPRTSVLARRVRTSTPPTVTSIDVVDAAQSGLSPRVDFTLLATSGATSWLLVSLPAPPIALPPLGDLWLDPASTILVGGFVHQTDVVTTQVTLAAPIPTGTAITAQMAVVRPSGVSLGDPCHFVVR
ncbi:MAG: hypothetical protein U1F36_03445 [Planctomycetota bacterium]